MHLYLRTCIYIIHIQVYIHSYACVQTNNHDAKIQIGLNIHKNNIIVDSYMISFSYVYTTVRVCVCVFAYVYTTIRVCVFAYVYTTVRVCVCLLTFTQLYVCVCLLTFTQLYVCVCLFTCTFTQLYVCVCRAGLSPPRVPCQICNGALSITFSEPSHFPIPFPPSFFLPLSHQP